MNSIQLDTLLDVLGAIPERPPENLNRFLSQLPHPAELPSPWATWTLIGLGRHRQRQLWVEKIIRTRLNGDPEQLARMGALGHPSDVPQMGTVPGLPEWEYYFHGQGCCLTHKIEGDEIDVDFWDENAEYFSSYFYQNYLRSLRHPEPPEQRLLELHPEARTISFAVAELLELGALDSHPDHAKTPYKLSKAVILSLDNIDWFCELWLDLEFQLSLSLIIGDWLKAETLVDPNSQLNELVSSRATKCRERRVAQLSSPNLDELEQANALRAMADLPVINIDSILEDAIRKPVESFNKGKPQNPIGRITLTALQIIDERNDPSWCPLVDSLFKLVNADDGIPDSHAWMTTFKLLLKHQYRVQELLENLPNASGTCLGEAVLLSLEHAPQHSIQLIRRALQSSIPICRTEVAAILAIFNTTWSRNELLNALNQSTDQHQTSEVRAALLEINEPEAEKAVLAWEKLNPHQEEVGVYIEIDGQKRGPFYSMNELSLRNNLEMLRYDMQELHDRVMQVRHVIPTGVLPDQ